MGNMFTGFHNSSEYGLTKVVGSTTIVNVKFNKDIYSAS